MEGAEGACPFGKGQYQTTMWGCTLLVTGTTFPDAGRGLNVENIDAAIN